MFLFCFASRHRFVCFSLFNIMLSSLACDTVSVYLMKLFLYLLFLFVNVIDILLMFYVIM